MGRAVGDRLRLARRYPLDPEAEPFGCRAQEGDPAALRREAALFDEYPQYPSPGGPGIVRFYQGDGCAKAWGCDLTYDYVKINGDYRT